MSDTDSQESDGNRIEIDFSDAEEEPTPALEPPPSSAPNDRLEVVLDEEPTVENVNAPSSPPIVISTMDLESFESESPPDSTPESVGKTTKGKKLRLLHTESRIAS